MNKFQNIALYCVVAVLYATQYLGARISVESGQYSTYAAAALRFSIAAFVCLALCLRKGWRNRARVASGEGKWLIGVGLCSAASFALMYSAAPYIPSALVSIMQATVPFGVAALLLITRLEPVPPISIAGFMVALVGIVIVFCNGLNGSYHVVAILAALAAAATMSGTNICCKQARETPILAAQTIIYLVSSTCLWARTLADGSPALPWPLPWRQTVAIIYLGLCVSAGGFALYLRLMRRIGVIRTSTVVFVAPAIAFLAGTMFESNSHLSTGMILGVVLVPTGVAINWIAVARAAAAVQGEPAPC